MYLIDTHTHFDVPEYHHDYAGFINRAFQSGVRHVVLIGYLAKYFDRMLWANDVINQSNKVHSHLAFGLHPLYIKEQSDDDLLLLEQFICRYQSIAIGEIGLDTFDKSLMQETIYQKQQRFFIEQIKLAQHHHLPIILHIRKAHADVLKILKAQKYKAHHQGGIAHSFSGGDNEALALVQMGFKIGITAQITNPNAKKLRRAVKTVFDKYGVSAFVIETDCPDMLSCVRHGKADFNEPAFLVDVVETLSLMFAKDKETLAEQLWQNTEQAFNIKLQMT